MIKRYATPYEYFILPFTKDQISDLLITYMQNGQIILEKNLSDIIIYEPNDLDNATMNEPTRRYYQKIAKRYKNYCGAMVHLTQEESALFTFHRVAEKNIAVVQVNLLDTKNDAFVSYPIHIRILGNIKEGGI